MVALTPNCNPKPVTQSCTYGGTYPNCNPKPTTVPVQCNDGHGSHGANCQEGVEEGWIKPEESLDLNEPPESIERLQDIGEEFADANPDVGFDAEAYANALEGVPYPPQRGPMAQALCAGLPSCNSNGTPAQQIQYLLDNGISFGQTEQTVTGFNAWQSPQHGSNSVVPQPY